MRNNWALHASGFLITFLRAGDEGNSFWRTPAPSHRCSPFWDALTPPAGPWFSHGTGGEPFTDVTSSPHRYHRMSSCLWNTSCRARRVLQQEEISSIYALTAGLSHHNLLLYGRACAPTGQVCDLIHLDTTGGVWNGRSWRFFPSWKVKLWTEVCISSICRAFL